jgi:four helix bundle protein
MSTLKQFEDIESWRKARELVNAIYLLTRQQAFARDFALRDQIVRSAISVMANIAEGFEREGNREFINFLTTAKASLAETKSHLYLALDQKYISPEDFAKLGQQILDTSRLIGGFIRYLQQSEISGRKFRVVSSTRNSKLQTRN